MCEKAIQECPSVEPAANANNRASKAGSHKTCDSSAFAKRDDQRRSPNQGRKSTLLKCEKEDAGASSGEVCDIYISSCVRVTHVCIRRIMNGGGIRYAKSTDHIWGSVQSRFRGQDE